MAKSENVYILGGAQSDFARNWNKEGKHFSAVMRETVCAGMQQARIEPSEIQTAHVGNFAAELYGKQGQLNAAVSCYSTGIALRPTAGLSLQSTYIFAKTLGVVPGNWNNPLDRNADYAPLYQAVRHDLRTNGTFELPVGPGKMLFAKSSGWLGHLVEPLSRSRARIQGHKSVEAHRSRSTTSFRVRQNAD